MDAGAASGTQAGGQQLEAPAVQPDRTVDTILFNDGSKYTGTLKISVPDGLGTCIWKDGNQYDGEWKNGVMHGFGTYIWTSGQRYDGEWKEGKRDGVGMKLYADGSSFNGFWRDGKKHGVGVFRPAPEPRRSLAKTSSGRLAGGPGVESVANLSAYESVQGENPPLPVTTPSPTAASAAAAAAAGPPDREKERKAVFIRAFEDGQLVREEKLSGEDAKMIFGPAWQPKGSKTRSKVKRALGIGKKLQEKQGVLMYKGMPGYDLMTKLQHGIRWSVGRSHEPPGSQQPSADGVPPGVAHKLQPSDFTEKTKVFFPSSGSSITPAHPSSDFKWKDYSPKVFRNLRNMFGIQDAEYMLSLGGSAALWQLNSPGKSGCMFFLSDDEKFLVKTMRKTEIRTLIDMLPRYYKHMESNPCNLVIRFFGVHGVKQVHGRTVRFVVMHNMFNTELQIHKKFDLKGSTDGRTTGADANSNDSKIVWKDLDLDVQLLLDRPTYHSVISQIKADAEFLKGAEVMDYSLLLGLHFCARRRAEEAELGAASGYGGVRALRHIDSAGSNGVDEREADDAAPPGGGPIASTSSRGDRNGSITSTPPAFGRPPSGGGSAAAAPGGAAGNAGGMSSGPAPATDEETEHIKNFDLFTDRQDLPRQLAMFEERMREMSYSQQRIQDILSLARLRILGDKLKKRSKKASKVTFDGDTLLKAIASRRHDPEALARVDESGDDGAGSDDDGDATEGGAGAAGPPHIGYHVRALAVPKKPGGTPEEVVLYFGIIDILQDWNTRKVVERTWKSLLHDSYAISVAPPKLYGTRFSDFLTRDVFLDPDAAAQRGLALPRGPYTVPTIQEEDAHD